MITHKLREILAVTDNVSVMRRGEMVGTLPTADATAEKLAELMVGRRVLLRVTKADATPDRTVLDVKNLTIVDTSRRRAG